MLRSARAELLKVVTLRSSAALLAGGAALVALTAAATLAADGRAGTLPVATDDGLRNVFTTASSGVVLVAVAGLLLVANEFRHGTARATLLDAGSPVVVMAAKLAASVVAAAVYTLVAATTLALLAVPWLASDGVGLGRQAGPLARATVTTVGVAAAYAVLGVCVGAVVRHQVAGVLVVVAWVFLGEGLVLALAPDAYRWLPGGAANGLFDTTTGSAELLGTWAAAGVVTAYAAAAVVVAVVAFAHREP